jgi:hypothetical protein
MLGAITIFNRQGKAEERRQEPHMNQTNQVLGVRLRPSATGSASPLLLTRAEGRDSVYARPGSLRG